MHYRRGLLKRLSPGDRVAVTLLRGGECLNATAEIRKAFAILRNRAKEADLIVLEVAAQSVSPFELTVLGWLAAWQRDRVEPAIEDWRITISEVQVCAHLLDRAGYRLDYRHVAQLAGQEDKDIVRKLAYGRMYAAPDFVTPVHRSMRHQILDALASRGPMTMKDLEKLGVSRQTISNMVKRGHLTRIRLGVYAVPDKFAPAKLSPFKAR